MKLSANEEQYQAIMHPKGPVLVVAGAGSGKTFVLTNRIRKMIETDGIPAHKILAITFTNKAAQEMKNRLSDLIETVAIPPFIGTFHALCAKILRESFHVLGRKSSFQILDKSDQNYFIRLCFQQFGFTYSKDHINIASHYLGKIKQQLNMNETCMALESQWRSEIDLPLSDFLSQYNTLLTSQNAVDFNDLLQHAYQLLLLYPEIRQKYQERFEFCSVDEFQDSNDLQVQIIHLISQVHQNITVVGDYDQTIYSWRGANPQHMLNFHKLFPTVETIFLKQNYRSTQTILEAANHLIQHNTRHDDKVLWTQNEKGTELQFIISNNEKSEAAILAQLILSLVNSKDSLSYQNIGILYRINAQSRAIEEAFITHKIPYQLIGSIRFYDRQEIKDILAYFQLIQNPNHQLAFSRAIQRPNRRIGSTTIEKIFQFSNAQKLSLIESLTDPRLDISDKARQTIVSFFNWIESLQKELLEHLSLARIFDTIIENTQYYDYLERQSKLESAAKIETVQEMRTVCLSAENLDSFLEEIALKSEQDSIESDRNQVTCMTLHHAKGLEFSIVFIIGFEDGLFPYYKSQHSSQEQEEERRLAYVGITRAQESLYLLGTTQRTLFGYTVNPSLSSYISEIPKHLINCQITPDLISLQHPVLSAVLSEGIRYTPFRIDYGKKGSIDVKLSPGIQVYHKVWGHGTISNIEGDGDSAIYAIQFNGALKKLMAKYAAIEVV